ncbi:hypothetical protein NPIL_195491 [Nephila pilipes]|uniref:Uncharacterized protein n=1 Tax=Nephila pilipes TaxID=299642 RepID=A0A8X6TJS6_NEPPI|nr:hypothetical protein NPIL_195491 [Nephila pilipes]
MLSKFISQPPSTNCSFQFQKFSNKYGYRTQQFNACDSHSQSERRQKFPPIHEMPPPEALPVDRLEGKMRLSFKTSKQNKVKLLLQTPLMKVQ